MGLNSAELDVRFSAAQTGSNDFGGPDFRPIVKKILQFTSGTAAGQADILFVDTRTVVSGTPDDIDLSGALTDAFGASVVSAEIVGLLINHKSGTGTLSVGVAGTNPWVTMFAASGDGIKVFPGGLFVNFGSDASGLGAVVGGASDVLRVTASAGTVIFDLAVLARTA
jgi:hypothetical protein